MYIRTDMYIHTYAHTHTGIAKTTGQYFIQRCMQSTREEWWTCIYLCIYMHAYIHTYVCTHIYRDREDHGAIFHSKMHEINAGRVADMYRPTSGYHVTVYHSFNDEVAHYRVHWWKCQTCK